MNPRYDAIVLGVGGMGSAAAYHLARRGKRVLGLEQFDIPHRMGSSHGLTRIIRLAYHESPLYVPMLRRAYENWRALEAAFGEQLLFVTGSLDVGPPEGALVQGALGSCLLHDLDHEMLDAGEVGRRFPAYGLPGDHVALFQPEGGFVASERAIVAHVTLAQSHGAEIRARERVLGWEPLATGVAVATDRGRYQADRLIVSAGAWIGGLVPALAAHAIPERQVLGWFQPETPALFAPGRFPVFNADFPEGRFYGLPVWGMPGFKIGRYHHMRETIGNPDRMDRTCTTGDEALLREAVARYFPAANGPVMGLASCLFTNTADEHFVIDTLPGAPQVVVASPCSGHGYKFASAIGEILADLAIAGTTDFDLAPFRLSRFDPGPA